MVHPVELSFVIPVFNGSRTIEDIVPRIHAEYRDLAIEVVLVNDGSQTRPNRRALRCWLHALDAVAEHVSQLLHDYVAVSALLGLATSVVSVFLLIAVVVDKLYINPELLVGNPTILVTIVFFAGIQLVILGTIGAYLGRMFVDQTKGPQFVMRYVRRGHDAG